MTNGLIFGASLNRAVPPCGHLKTVTLALLHKLVLIQSLNLKTHTYQKLLGFLRTLRKRKCNLKKDVTAEHGHVKTTVAASHVRDAPEPQSCNNRCLHYTVNIVKPLCLDSLQNLNFGLLYFIFLK